MGLDVTAYESVRLVPGCECEGDTETHRRLFVEPGFAERADGMQPGCYVSEGKERDFRAGSYSGYGGWRRGLALTMLGVTPEAIWNDEAAFAGRPFVELIDFSDCEGVIGPRTSAKLARDFAEHRAKATEYVPESGREWWLERYDEFAAGFALAAREGGCVKFH